MTAPRFALALTVALSLAGPPPSANAQNAEGAATLTVHRAGAGWRWQVIEANRRLDAGQRAQINQIGPSRRPSFGASWMDGPAPRPLGGRDRFALDALQLPGRLRPTPNALAHLGGKALYRAICSDGTPPPTRQCERLRDNYDANQLVDALLRAPNPETQGAIKFFGLPNVDGVPPAAILIKPASPYPAPLAVLERDLRRFTSQRAR